MVREMLNGESNHLHTWLQIYQLHELCSLGDRGVQDTTLLLHTLRGYIEKLTSLAMPRSLAMPTPPEEKPQHHQLPTRPWRRPRKDRGEAHSLEKAILLTAP